MSAPEVVLDPSTVAIAAQVQESKVEEVVVEKVETAAVALVDKVVDKIVPDQFKEEVKKMVEDAVKEAIKLAVAEILKEFKPPTLETLKEDLAMVIGKRSWLGC